ncbi:DUF1705 domain-containing protein [Polaromonas sp. P2-4]|nr:DUF1705 domain-containing protein [Polaromonas sp. P2-4]
MFAFCCWLATHPFGAALAGRGWELAATWGFAAALFAALAAFYFAFAALLATRLTVKPLLSVLVLCTAFSSWYMDRYAIYLDRAMLRNVLATNIQEARELLVWGMVPHLLLVGVVPAVLLWWPRLKQAKPAASGGCAPSLAGGRAGHGCGQPDAGVC